LLSVVEQPPSSRLRLTRPAVIERVLMVMLLLYCKVD